VITLLRQLAIIAALLCLTPVAACTPREPVTGDVATPRGQRYTFDYVEQHADQLRAGMSQLDVLLLLGSPAERQGEDWVYLPSREGIVLPAQALRVEFDDGRYVKHRYEPVVLGERLPLPD